MATPLGLSFMLFTEIMYKEVLSLKMGVAFVYFTEEANNHERTAIHHQFTISQIRGISLTNFIRMFQSKIVVSLENQIFNF